MLWLHLGASVFHAKGVELCHGLAKAMIWRWLVWNGNGYQHALTCSKQQEPMDAVTLSTQLGPLTDRVAGARLSSTRP